MERPSFIGKPILAVKLTPAGQKQQQKDPQFLSNIIQEVLPGNLVPIVEPLISSVSAEDIEKLVDLAVKLDPSYQRTDFNAWYKVSIVIDNKNFLSAAEGKDGKDDAARKDPIILPGWLIKVVTHLRERTKEIEDYHFLIASPPPAVDASDDPQSGSQGYLDAANAAKAGINARFAWTVPGGDGANARVVDIERGWNLDHADLEQQRITQFGPGLNNSDRRHGTNVLGVMLMRDNLKGGVGIAPAGNGRVVSEILNGAVYDPPVETTNAIFTAIQQMSFGDILLLETQANDPDLNHESLENWPTEIQPSVWAAIRLATAIGISVIEPAGNGVHDLDIYDTRGKRIWSRGDPNEKDSGAVMVASAISATRARHSSTNFGSRIDCYSWGDGVLTTGMSETDIEFYSDGFGETSSASAIVAGAAMIIQSIAQTQLGYKLSPHHLREILKIGTPSASVTDRIGPAQPDLKKILEDQLINVLPNLYIRDNIADDGSRSSGSVSASPDIIIRQESVGNASQLFGEANRNSPSLSQNVLKRAGNGSHFLYIRVLNNSSSEAKSAKANVYWSEPTTLVTPNTWLGHKIGTVSFGSVPAGNVVTVSPELPWSDVDIPAEGHYCFVCIVEATGDAAPTLPEVFADPNASFASFVQFVQNNNNVAWRNFNVISAPQQNNRPYHSFPFLVPGAFDLDRIFSLRSIASLPRGSTISLKLPLPLSRALKIRLRKGELIEKEKFALIPLHPFGNVEIGQGILEKGSMERCQLQVQVPKDIYTRKGIYEVAIAQFWEGIEVGRLTFRFGQREERPVGRKGGKPGEGYCEDGSDGDGGDEEGKGRGKENRTCGCRCQ